MCERVREDEINNRSGNYGKVKEVRSYGCVREGERTRRQKHDGDIKMDHLPSFTPHGQQESSLHLQSR